MGFLLVDLLNVVSSLPAGTAKSVSRLKSSSNIDTESFFVEAIAGIEGLSCSEVSSNPLPLVLGYGAFKLLRNLYCLD